MAKVYYSTVFEHPAGKVWGVIRDFNSYPDWVATVSESHIEDGRAGDAVGAIRNFKESGTPIRQRLLAHSDLERLYTYESCGPLGAITYYQGTAKVTPIIDGDHALVEWSIALECPEAERSNCIAILKNAMPQWMASLREVLGARV